MTDGTGETNGVGDTRPIGVFDSGMGGLTVLKALHARLPRESFVYFGDTARLPYGTKSSATVTAYALQAVRLLANENVKMIVVACNTASAVALKPLAAAFAPTPVIGVVEPGARAGVSATRNGRIAVIATESTVRGGAYMRTIHALDPAVQVVQQPCALFVALAEEGWTEGDVAQGAARRYLSALFQGAEAPDTLLLGCTHFPVLLPAISTAIDAPVTIVDSAATTADAVAKALAPGLAAPAGHTNSVRFFASDSPQRFAQVGRVFLGDEIGEADVELVDI